MTIHTLPPEFYALADSIGDDAPAGMIAAGDWPNPLLTTPEANPLARRLGHGDVAGDDGCFPYYGSFNGGDPRAFQPDPECGFPREWEAWRIACEAADAGACDALDPAHTLDERGAIARECFGLGLNHRKPGPWRTWAARPDVTPIRLRQKADAARRALTALRRHLARLPGHLAALPEDERGRVADELRRGLDEALAGHAP